MGRGGARVGGCVGCPSRVSGALSRIEKVGCHLPVWAYRGWAFEDRGSTVGCASPRRSRPRFHN